MFCPICGKENPEGSTFCAGCGKPIAAPAAPVAPVVPQQPAPQAQPQPQPQQQYAAPQQPQYAAPQAPVAPAKPSKILPFGEFFKSLITAAIKPVTGASDEAKKYDVIGNSLILSAIVVGILTIANFLFYILRMTIYGTWPRRVGDSFVNLFRNFTGSLLDYALMTFGFAAVMFVAGNILKEKWSFSRLLAICSMTTFAPEAVRVLIIRFFTSVPSSASWYYTMLRYFPISSILSTAASIYAFILLYEAITRETKLEGNKKGFVFAIAYVALQFVSHYIGLIY